MMKIAVTYEDGQVFQHFGHCGEFKIYETEKDTVISSQVYSTGESGHGALAGFLKEHGVGHPHLRRYRRRRTGST